MGMREGGYVRVRIGNTRLKAAKDIRDHNGTSDTVEK